MIKLFSRGDKVTKLKFEDIFGDLAVFNVSGSFEYASIETLGKQEHEAPTALETWYERVIPFMA